MQHWSNTHCSFTPSFHVVTLSDVLYHNNLRFPLSGLKVHQGLTYLFLFYSLIFQSIFSPIKCSLPTPQLWNILCSQSNTFKIRKHLQIYIHILSYRNHQLLLITSTSNTFPGQAFSHLALQSLTWIISLFKLDFSVRCFPPSIFLSIQYGSLKSFKMKLL